MVSWAITKSATLPLLGDPVGDTIARPLTTTKPEFQLVWSFME